MLSMLIFLIMVIYLLVISIVLYHVQRETRNTVSLGPYKIPIWNCSPNIN